jgi:hypothetical protein
VSGLHARIDEVFAGGADLAVALERVAQLGAQLLLQAAIEGEVAVFLGPESRVIVATKSKIITAATGPYRAGAPCTQALSSYSGCGRVVSLPGRGRGRVFYCADASGQSRLCGGGLCRVWRILAGRAAGALPRVTCDLR